jgi:hypothetical protein
MLPGLSHSSTNGDGPIASTLIDLADVCKVFESAYRIGGAEDVLRLLERSQFIAAIQHELVSSANRAHVEVASSADDGCGVEYSMAGSEGQTDVLGRSLPEGGHLWTRADTENKQKKCWLHGSQWWLRHWAGSFIAERVVQHNGAPAADALILWLQEAHSMNDFVWTSALHGALYQVIAPLGMSVSMASQLRYPSALAQKLCHDRVRDVYECRHGIGHGVFYAVLMSHGHMMANYSACMQPRPYSIPNADQMLDDARVVCDQARSIPTFVQQHTYQSGCVSGSTHSWYLFDAKLGEYGRSGS